MLYPILKQCETQALITVKNITLRNVVSTDGVLPPGIIRCNETNPCRDIYFENVDATGWFTLLNYGYITENALGSQWLSFPSPGFQSELSTKTSTIDWAKWFLRGIDYRDNEDSNSDYVRQAVA
jgi:hypothetical protein